MILRHYNHNSSSNVPLATCPVSPLLILFEPVPALVRQFQISLQPQQQYLNKPHVTISDVQLSTSKPLFWRLTSP